ncbi:MAG: ATP-binding protein [Planctomycetota bacterium]
MDFLKEGYEQIYNLGNFENEPSFFGIIRESVVRIREKHLSLKLPSDPGYDNVIAYKNWCIDALQIIDESIRPQTTLANTKQNGGKTISQLIQQGEGRAVEFKEMLEYSVRENKQDTNLNKECLKTIAAFLNTDGGTLLIGVRDNGEITGIERDLQYVQRKNKDGFELKLRDLIKSHLAPFPSGKINIQFETLTKGMVCRVDIEPVNKNQTIHLGKDVYIRDGNTTRKLEGRDLTDWIQQRNN